MSFSTSLISLRIMPSRSNQVIQMGGFPSFLLLNNICVCVCVCVCVDIFLRYLVIRHLGFRILASVNKAAVDMGV